MSRPVLHNTFPDRMRDYERRLMRLELPRIVGGGRFVIEAVDATALIPAQRHIGMVVAQTGTSSIGGPGFYELVGGIADIDYEVFVTGGGGGIPTVTDLTTVTGRYIGMIVYQSVASTIGPVGTYQLLGGVTDAYWFLLTAFYEPPTVGFTIGIDITRDAGDTASTVPMTIGTTPGSAPVSTIEIYRDGVLIDTIDHVGDLSGDPFVDLFTDTTPVSVDTNYDVFVYDATGHITAATSAITFTDAPPTVTLSLNAFTNNSPYEKTVDVLSPSFSVTVVEHSYPIVDVKLYRGATMIHDFSSALAPSGGTATYTDTSGCTDTSVYTVKVNDGVTAQVTSNAITFTFHYPTFSGVSTMDATTIDETELRTLTTDLTRTTKPNATYTYTTSSERMVIAYPNSFGALSHAKDPSNFELIGNFDVDTSLTIDGVTYRVYDYAFPTTLTGYDVDFS